LGTQAPYDVRDYDLDILILDCVVQTTE